MNPFLVGIEAALKEYPFIGDDFERLFDGNLVENPHRECLYLLLSVYKQYELGRISSKDVLWSMKKLCEILDY